jgi:hypothetical protein|tara:strand:- start:8 stop:421 length:414 start_codon:yes stop_codon:yes gene_type:complete
MSIIKILNSLEISWSREKILTKIKNGHSTDEIINEFLIKNKEQIKELNTLLRPEDIDLLNKVEILSTCEAKLINKINNLNYLKNKDKHYKINEKQLSLPNRIPANKISLFMVNWSNKIVIISLLTISAIALSKQAWA